MTNARRALGRTGGWKTQLGYYAMFLVPALWMLLFSYLPMAGIYLAFIDYTKCTSCGKCATVCPKHLITDAGLTAPVLEHSAG